MQLLNKWLKGIKGIIFKWIKNKHDLNEPFFVKQLPTVRPIYHEFVLFSKSNTPKKRKSGQLKKNLAHVIHVEFIIHTF